MKHKINLPQLPAAMAHSNWSHPTTISKMVHARTLDSSNYAASMTPTENNYALRSVFTHGKVAAAANLPMSRMAHHSMTTNYPQLSKKFHLIDNSQVSPTASLISPEKVKLKSKTKRYMVISTLSFLFAGISYQMYNPMIDSVLESQMELKNGSALLQSWLEVPIPMYVSFHLFGLRNANAFLRGAKPDVKEYGPYVYKQWRTRDIVEWKSNTVVFTEKYRFDYQADMSASKETRLTVVNYPLFVIMLQTKNMLEQNSLGFLSPIVHNLINVVLGMTGENLIEVRTAGELLDGRPIQLLVYIEKLIKPLQALGLPFNLEAIQTKLPNNSFGLVLNRANIDTGPYENYLRTEQGHMCNEAAKLFGKNKFPNFRPPCNHVSGSDGMFFGTHLDAPYITFYNPQICRTIRFIRNMTLNHKGIHAIHYRLPEYTFDSSRIENRCYCTESSLAQCDGWSDITGCADGAPLAMSLPHFVYSPRQQKQILGLRPDPSKHVSFMDIEPNLGIPVQANVGIQINLQVDNFNMVPALSRLRKTLLPMLWLGTRAGVEEASARFLMIGLYVINYGQYATLAAGLLLCSLFLGKGYREWNKTRKMEKV